MMRRFMVGGLIWGAVILPAGAENLVSRMDASVVRILAMSDDGLSVGTGFVINDQGAVVTNQHVVANAHRFIVAKGVDQSRWKEAQLRWSSEGKDLAVLVAPGLALPPAPLAAGIPEKTTRVVSFGFPAAADTLGSVTAKNYLEVLNDPNWVESTATQGIVGRVITASWVGKGIDKFAILQHDAAIHEGNSGGPLFNTCGQVIGVNTAGLVDKESNASSGLYYSTSSSVLTEALRQAGIGFTNLSAPCDNATPGEGKEAAAPPPAPPVPIARTLPKPVTPPPSPPPAVVPEPPVAASSWEFRLTREHLLWSGGGLAVLALLASCWRWARWWQERLLRRGRRGEVRPVAEQAWVLAGYAPGGAGVRLSWSEGQMQDHEKGLVIGRSRRVADLAIPHETVSMRHARIVRYEGDLYLEDLNTTNGTQVNGRSKPPYTPQLLPEGAEVRLGEVRLTLTQARRGEDGGNGGNERRR